MRMFSKRCSGKIFSLTAGVPPDRQKVMVAGVTVLDEDWGKAKAKIKEVE